MAKEFKAEINYSKPAHFAIVFNSNLTLNLLFIYIQQKTQMIQDQHFLTHFSVSFSAMLMSSLIFFMARLSSLGLNLCVSSLSLQANPFITLS